jgi:hypothetical protein
MLAIPLAWLQLTYQKGRLAIAIAGVMFAVILIAMQLGFRDALFKSAVLLQLVESQTVLSPSPLSSWWFYRRKVYLSCVHWLSNLECLLTGHKGRYPRDRCFPSSQSILISQYQTRFR